MSCYLDVSPNEINVSEIPHLNCILPIEVGAASTTVYELFKPVVRKNKICSLHAGKQNLIPPSL